MLQCGADLLSADPLGGGNLTTYSFEQVLRLLRTPVMRKSGHDKAESSLELPLLMLGGGVCALNNSTGSC